MLDWLKETDKAKRLEDAIAKVIAEGKVRTYDMGGKNTTMEVAPPLDGLAVARGAKASTLNVAKAIADYASS